MTIFQNKILFLYHNFKRIKSIENYIFVYILVIRDNLIYSNLTKLSAIIQTTYI